MAIALLKKRGGALFQDAVDADEHTTWFDSGELFMECLTLAIRLNALHVSTLLHHTRRGLKLGVAQEFPINSIG